MTRLGFYAGAIVTLLAIGAWLGWQARGGYEASLRLDEMRVTAARAAETREAEMQRLAQQAARDLAIGEIVNDTYRDPDRDLPALGLRDAQRLNAVR